MRRRRAVLARSLVLPVLTALLAGGVAVHGAPPTAARAVRVVPLDGPPVEARIAGLSAEGVRLEGREAPLPLAEVREIRFAAEAPPAALPEDGIGLRVVLRGGESLRGTLVSGSEEGLVLRPLGLDEVTLPFDLVRRVEAEGPGRGPCDEPARERPPRPGSDVAWVRSGDAFGGTVVSAGRDGILLEIVGDRHTVAWADLVVLHLDEPEMPPAEGLLAEVDTTGGSRLIGSVDGLSAAGLAVRTRSGLSVAVPTEAVAVVRWTGGRFVYASDLPFTSTFTPYYRDKPREPADREASPAPANPDDLLDARWLERWYGARADRTPNGCPLRVAGVTFRHGIAVHAKSVVKVPLGKAYVRFEARFGIDDEALAAAEGPRGDVTARVLADGREVWTSGGSVKGGEAARVVGPVDVTGVDALVLEVDFGAEQHQMDRADWGDPVLVRAK